MSDGPSPRTWIILAVCFTISGIGCIAGALNGLGVFDEKPKTVETTIAGLIEARDYDKIVYYNDEYHLKENMTDQDWEDARDWERGKEIPLYEPDEISVSGFYVRIDRTGWSSYFFDPFERVHIYQTDVSEETPRVRLHARGTEYRFNCRGEALAKAFHDAYGIKASMVSLTGEDK